MKWALLVVGILTVAIVLAAVVGARLPRAHVASRSIKLRRPPADVWSAITQAAGASRVPVDVIESDPPRRQVTRVSEKEQMFGGTWTITVAPDGDGTIATIVEEGWVESLLFRFVSRYVIGHHATIDAILKSVAKTFGEPAAMSGD